MPERQIKVVCGLNNETNILLKERLQEAATEKGIKLQIVSRYRKEGVYQYVTEHPDYQYVILQEILQSSSPYTAEDVALLTDERNVRVVIVLNKNHAGNRYMRVLYAAGILDALYEEDAYAEKIVDLLSGGRSRKEARKYYGIETVADVEKTLQIIDEERLKSFLGYVESGGPLNETVSRYEFVAARMTAAENLHLIKNMGSRLPGMLLESELFLYYNGYFTGKPKKWYSFLQRKEKNPLEPEAVLRNKKDEKKDETVIEAGSNEGEENFYIEPLPEKKLEPDANIASAPADAKKLVIEEAGNDTFADTYEEESLFDLFEEDGHASILHFIEEERGEPEQEPEKVQESLPIKNLEKAEEKGGKDTETFPLVPLPAEEPVSRLSKERNQDKRNGVRDENETSDGERRMPEINKKILLIAGMISLCLLLFLFCLIGIYSEKEIPMIEEIPVSAEPEEEKPLEEELLQEPAVMEPVTKPEHTDDSIESVEESQEDEMEERDVQEETKENEPQGAVGIAEESKPAKVSRSSGKSNSQQEIVSTERTTGSTAGEEPATAAVTAWEPDVIISRETLAQEDETEGVSQELNVLDCNGKIFSGDELGGVVVSLQQSGFRVYIITRENGEGYFSIEQIREKCGGACSFLVSVSGSEVKVIEQ